MDDPISKSNISTQITQATLTTIYYRNRSSMRCFGKQLLALIEIGSMFKNSNKIFVLKRFADREWPLAIPGGCIIKFNSNGITFLKSFS